MGRASREKGARGESRLVQSLRSIGVVATREGWKQRSKEHATMSPDVRSLEGLTPENGNGHQFRIPAVAWEVKNVKSLPPKVIRDALQQARDTADGGPCALAMHLPGTKHWGIYIETSDWSLSDFGFESEGEISK